NYDAAENGVNRVLCERIGLKDIYPCGNLGYSGYVGENPVSLQAFCRSLKESLNVGAVFAADGGVPVNKVMVVGGSGGDFLQDAIRNGCDTLLTGEAAHHEGIEAIVQGINLIYAGHYATENPSIPNLCMMVQERVGGLADCFVSVRNKDPFMQI
ncbi:MAG: Nif3-like dinuclear metal center hexameric protein, partial [Oscillospiraceae bacterium]|nr:Nif3-like dinuclear metal center hexameric protein [Oscillospiraceae bacterium]